MDGITHHHDRDPQKDEPREGVSHLTTVHSRHIGNPPYTCVAMAIASVLHQAGTATGGHGTGRRAGFRIASPSSVPQACPFR